MGIYSIYKGPVTNYGEGGGATKWKGVGGKFHNYKIKKQQWGEGGGGRKRLRHTEGRVGEKVCRLVLTRELEVLAMLKGGAQKSFHHLKGGGVSQKVFPCLEESAKCVGLAIFPFCSPPLLFNDHSLRSPDDQSPNDDK